MRRCDAASVTILAFPSELGWLAVEVADDGAGTVRRLTFGHKTAEDAERTIVGLAKRSGRSAGVVCRSAGVPPAVIKAGGTPALRQMTPAHRQLIKRLQAFAAGKGDRLDDIPVDQSGLSDFQRRVMKRCRSIPYGRTISYAELAAKAGSPRAARAVGSCMAGNRIPLIVPCHRVVCADGRLGSYSAPGGVGVKRRLLALESGK